ncbi:hypothetical protein B0H16DRAFT_1893647 [Mycena metata]|uniref:Uncharacterized protein n=1 Tax=Mycena metata TaxID=1033252 RepID=A0AAD7MTM4_9AGAR|nr:hypothetical protein B0H16DRAFT_1893647 [Mycena metata]
MQPDVAHSLRAFNVNPVFKWQRNSNPNPPPRACDNHRGRIGFFECGGAGRRRWGRIGGGETNAGGAKVYSAVVALAIRRVGAGGSEGWGGWLASTAEDVGSGRSLWRPRIHIEQSLRAPAPLVLESISSVLASAVSGQDNTQDPDALLAALALLVA